MITAPGIYPPALVPIEAYHGQEICPAPSISASGLHRIARSPLHYWADSPLNPDRPLQERKRHFSIGKAVHDRLLLGERWPDAYHILPEGFSRAKSKAMADAIEAADDAEAAGKVLLSVDDAAMVMDVARAVEAQPTIAAALAKGDAEHTIAWQDQLEGVWLRARPDCWLRGAGIVIDIKTAADASPGAISRAAASYGYFTAAALYMDGIEAVTGDRPQAFILVTIEKEYPFVVTARALDLDDVAAARAAVVRPGIARFAECLRAGVWPGYSDEPIRLPAWARRSMEQETVDE